MDLGSDDILINEGSSVVTNAPVWWVMLTGSMHVRDRAYVGTLSSSQFCSEPKTTL